MTNPTKIFIDFETQSNNDIRLGVNHYMSCPEFRAYLLSYSIDGKEIQTIRNPVQEETLNYEFDKELFEIILSGKYVVIAHNVNFDVAVWNKIFPALKIDWKKAFDTSWFSRVLNVPASLDKATKFFGVTELKDDEGKKLNSKYYKPVVIPENDLNRLILYNRQDVKALIDLYRVYESVELEQGNFKILDMIQRQNEIKIDKAKLNELGYLKEKIIREAEKKALANFPIYKKTGHKEKVSIVYSANEIKKYLKENGISLSTISKNKIEEELNLEGVILGEKEELLISLYRVLQSKGLSKYDTFFEYLPNVEKSKQLNYCIKDFQISHGAHTGRPAGRGLQLHNVSRPAKNIENLKTSKVVNLVQEEIKKDNFEKASKYLSSLLWSCMIPDSKNEVIARYDLSAIEPRVGAFLRDDKNLLELYRNADLGTGKDEYTIFGEKMNFPENILRQLSKIIILAACYGMGANALRNSCINAGLPDMGETQAKILLANYHAQNPSVKKAWYALESKFKLAILNDYSEYNYLEFKKYKIGGKIFIAVILPSGREKFYADCSISSNGKILYHDSRLGKIELRPYLLYENLVQASATDVLFIKASKIESLGIKVKLTIYDEIILSTSKSKIKQVKKIMSEEEKSFEGMPLSFKGSESFTFWKGDKI